jgi:hypothetical protein
MFLAVNRSQDRPESRGGGRSSLEAIQIRYTWHHRMDHMRGHRSESGRRLVGA